MHGIIFPIALGMGLHWFTVFTVTRKGFEVKGLFSILLYLFLTYGLGSLLLSAFRAFGVGSRS